MHMIYTFKNVSSLIFGLILTLLASGTMAQSSEDSVKMDALWLPDNGDGTYTNPILYADYSDPDIVKVNDDFYMVSSSFNCAPGIPVLHSKDLVNWTIIGHVFNHQIPDSAYNIPGHGTGVWAPSIRHHDGVFYVYYADPDYGIYVGKATNPAGPWEHKLVQKSYGWIDPCPFWDDNGEAYLVHAYAKSRSGIKSVLTLRKLSAKGDTLFTQDSTMIFDGNDLAHPRETLEGPKMYKRNGYYYIFAPYGGVAAGSQAVFRASDIKGPYQDSTILEQGITDINGPHQGGWVELESGESWFVHFQEIQPHGRVVHLQPMHWDNDWPVIGEDYDNNGIGEPVRTYTKPNVNGTFAITAPLTSDKFNESTLGKQWQWHSNFNANWYSLTAETGKLRLYANQLPSDFVNLWSVGSLLLQKPSAARFSVVAKVDLNLQKGDYAGLIIMGKTYGYLKALKTDAGITLSLMRCTDAKGGKPELELSTSLVNVKDTTIYMRLAFGSNGKCQFSYGMNGVDFTNLGTTVFATEGVWIGAKFGMFVSRPSGSEATTEGYADIDWINVDRYQNRLAEPVTYVRPDDGIIVTPGSRLRLECTPDPIYADSLQFYVGTDINNLTLQTIQTSNRYMYDAPEAGKKYYWRIDTKNEMGVTKGAVRSFTGEGSNGIEDDEVSTSIEINPNPMSQMAVVLFSVEKETSITVALSDVTGKLIKVIANKVVATGDNKVQILRGDLEAGTYFITIKTDDKTEIRKLIVE